MNKGVVRALALVSQIGINMLVPILGAVLAARTFFSGNTVVLILLVLLGIGVAFRNLYVVMMREFRRKSDAFKEVKQVRRGRPIGYEDEDPYDVDDATDAYTKPTKRGKAKE